MKLYFNCCDYELHAVNVRRVERIDYDPAVDEESERAYTFDDWVGRSFIGVGELTTDNSDYKFVIKK